MENEKSEAAFDTHEQELQHTDEIHWLSEQVLSLVQDDCGPSPHMRMTKLGLQDDNETQGSGDACEDASTWTNMTRSSYSSTVLGPDKDDIHLMTYGKDADVSKLPHMPSESRESNQTNPGAFQVGGQDNDVGKSITDGEEVRSLHATTNDAFKVSVRPVEEDQEEKIAVVAVEEDGRGNTKRFFTHGEEVKRHGTTTADTFQVNARLVEEDPEEHILGVAVAVNAEDARLVEEDPKEYSLEVAVVVEDEGGNKKCLIHSLMGALVILLMVAIVLGVTLSTRSSQPRTNPSPIWAPTSAPTLFLQRNTLCFR